MLSRRLFLFASLGVLIQPAEVFAAAKKKKPAELRKLGPRTLSREEWPPSISPEFIAISERGYALLSDQSGRVVIVDLKREEGPAVIGELGGLGRKTIDMAVIQGRAYALTAQEPGSDAQHQLVTVSILPSNDPTVLSRIPLSYLTEPVSVAATQDAVAVAGVTSKGENQVLLYGINSKRRPDESSMPLAALSFQQPITSVDLQEKQLLVLQAGARTQLDVFNVFNPRNPERVGSVTLDGNYPLLARTKEAIVVGGQSADRKLEVITIAPRPTPRAVARLVLPASELLDISMQRGQILVLANQINRLSVLPIALNPKALSMVLGQPAVLPSGTKGIAAKARIAVRDKDAYVASDWGGLQVLNISKNGWQYVYSHTVPRLPAAAIAAAGNRAVLAGADLKVYDISQPDHPVVVSTAELGGTVRSVTLVNNLLLALTRESLTLRRLDRPAETVASLNLGGQSLAYDPILHRAYVLSAKDKNTLVTPVRISHTLVAEKAETLEGLFNNASAANGKLLVSGLNTLALYTVADGLKLEGVRNFPNFAIRSISLQGDTAIIAAVDPNSRGYLLIVNTLNNTLNTIGSIDLPQDAAGLAVQGKTAVAVGRNSEGKDMASIVDVSSSVAPKIIASFPVVEAASAVTIKDQIALVVGRGLEILSLS